jgi:hypothetical protein
VGTLCVCVLYCIVLYAVFLVVPVGLALLRRVSLLRLVAVWSSVIIMLMEPKNKDSLIQNMTLQYNILNKYTRNFGEEITRKRPTWKIGTSNNIFLT